jgi:hypothetical protein
MQATTNGGRSSRTNLKWALKDSEHELLFPIASNKNRQESNTNLKAKAQLPK